MGFFGRRKEDKEIGIAIAREQSEAKIINTKSGLDIRIFSEGVEIEKRRNLIGVDISIVRRGDTNAPEGADYKISFYKSLGEVKGIMPGGIYIGRNGDIRIKGYRFPSEETPNDFGNLEA